MTAKFSDVEVSDRFDGDDEVRFGLRDEVDWLSRAEVRKLRDHLTGLLGDVTPVTTPALVEGQEYRLLPGAHCGADGTPEDCFSDVTRVLLSRSVPDSDGDVQVLILDGRNGGSGGWYVHTKFLAPLTEDTPASAATVAQAAREEAAEARRVGHVVTARHLLSFADRIERKSL
ncbi:hypothetical protein AB0J27_20200 [Micromonospora chokoriensis]